MTLYIGLMNLDFVLAVLLTVLMPLGLLVIAWQKPRLQQRLIGYWRVSALLMVSLYLLIAQTPLGFVTGILARVLIPLRLVLPLEPSHVDSRVYRVFNVWRSITCGYCVVGVLWTLPLVHCLVWQSAVCRAWYVPATSFRQLIHPTVAPHLLGWVGGIGVVIYCIAFGWLFGRAYRANTWRYVQRDDT
ncbi:MAG: DUF3177 family protein [Deinococcota bacterium]